MSLFGVRRFNDKSEEIKVNKEELVIETKEETKELVPIPFVNPFSKTDQTLPTESSKSSEPSIRTDDLIEDPDNKIKLATAHNNALDLLNSAVIQLKTDLTNVDSTKLPGVITAASKVVESIRKERLEVHKTGRDKEVHHHFYMPEQKKIEQYEVIDV